MTKRIYNFGENNNKKPKLDVDIEALWGEDIDESLLDDCIKTATQVFEENVTLTIENNANISNYSAFKQPMGKIFCSTQLDSFNCTQPGPSKDLPLSNKENCNQNLEKEIQILKDHYQEKEGEVTILRSQIKETKTNYNIEKNTIHNEWKKKFVNTEKQIQSVKSDLEFKNLEIANLKQKLVDITRRHPTILVNKSNFTNSSTSSSLHLSSKACHKLHAVNESDYPLSSIHGGVLFKFPKKENFIFKSTSFQSNRNAIPYLQNQQKPMKICLNLCDISTHILPILQKLLNSTAKELNSSQNISNINKVYISAVKLLENLFTLLQQIKSNLKTENILQADTIYIKTQKDIPTIHKECENEIGFNAGVLITFLAELVPLNIYLNDLIKDNGHINFQKDVYENMYMNYGRNLKGQTILDKIVGIVQLAGEIRKQDMTGFLLASIKLFTNICKTGNYNYICEYFCNFTKELIFLRPQFIVLLEMPSLLREASMYPPFVEFILNKSNNCSTTKRRIVYFNTDACRFYIFVLMFEKCLVKFEHISLDVCLNMSCFIYNIFKTSYWVLHQNTKECECLSHLYKLLLEIHFRALLWFKDDTNRTEGLLSKWHYLIKNKVIIKILSLMIFHSYDLTEKYITVLSQYKEIEKYFEEDETTPDLCTLSIIEELPEIPSKNFDKINF